MVNYKKIVDVDVLAEASESTNVLVEENGSLKKVPASAVGGGGVENNVILYVENGDLSRVEGMSFDAVKTCLMNGDLVHAYLFEFNISDPTSQQWVNLNNAQVSYRFSGSEYTGSAFEYIKWEIHSEYDVIFAYWLADNTLTRDEPQG